MKFWKKFLAFIESQFRTIALEIKDLHYSIKLNHYDLVPIILEANSNSIKQISNKSIEILPINEKRQTLIVQNIGFEPCYISLGKNVEPNSFHFILATDTGTHQGNGGSIELKNYHGKVYALCRDKTTTLSVLEY